MTAPKQQIAFPEVAVLRKGTPKVKGGQAGNFIQGKDLNNKFRISFYPGTTESRAAWQKAHPESYVKYDMAYRLPGTYAEPDGFEVERIRAMVPFHSVFDAWEWSNEAHSAGRMVAKADDDHYLMLRDPLNGTYLVQNGEPYTEFHHGQDVTYEKNGKKMVLPIRTVGRLRLFVPELERMVFITLKTTSYYDRLNIDAHLSAIQFLANTLNGGNAAGIPFFVYRREQEICWNKPDGSAQRIKKWLVNVEADPDWVKAATSRMANFALTGEIMTRALLPVGDTISGQASPDESDEDTAQLDPPEANDIVDAECSDVRAEQEQPLPLDWQAAKAAKEAEAPLVRPYSPDVFRAKFATLAAALELNNHLENVGEYQQRIVASALDGIFNGEKTMRYEVCNWLTGHSSTKDMSKAQVKAIMNVMGVTDFNQAPTVNAMTEFRQAHAAALVASGQAKLPF
ncbi:MAG: hypothetical protein JZU60_01940 [Ilumatobacteraceae bacterium]|jgi:hypothetical protein|nr:hypothetical protein [Ilumatobacteraceae bacterium]